MPYLLHSAIPFYNFDEEEHTLANIFRKEIERAFTVGLSTGYTSASSLEELGYLVDANCHALKQINLVLGMYLQEGMPESVYHAAMRLNNTWKSKGIGQIFVPRGIRNHEKVFLFWNENRELSGAVIGSANLSFLVQDARNRTQKEASVFFDQKDLENFTGLKTELESQMEQVLKNSIPIDRAPIALIREENTALKGIDKVEERTGSEVKRYLQNGLSPVYRIPLKVPGAEDRFSSKDREGHSTYVGSNINVCYAKPRINKSTGRYKPRDWYEMQLHVGPEIRRSEGYPQRNHPFFILTDDGYWFKGQTESDDNKQLSAVGNEHILGRWLKGRVAAAGLVHSVDDPWEGDPQRKGVITREMLKEFGSEFLLFGKTEIQAPDENGNILDVWYLSFDPKEVNKNELR